MSIIAERGITVPLRRGRSRLMIFFLVAEGVEVADGALGILVKCMDEYRLLDPAMCKARLGSLVGGADVIEGLLFDSVEVMLFILILKG